MIFQNTLTNNTYGMIFKFLRDDITFIELEQQIHRLDAKAILAQDKQKQTLFFKLVTLNASSPEDAYILAMRLLLIQAKQLSTPQHHLVSTLMGQCDSLAISPLQKILTNAPRSIDDSQNNFIETYYQFCNYDLNQNCIDHNQYKVLIGMDVRSLYHAFSCINTSTRSAYFNQIHQAIAQGTLNSSEYLQLYFNPLKDGFRVYDQLIAHNSVDQLNHFFIELKKMNEKKWISNSLLENILTSHLLPGFSPLHEVVRTQQYEKITLCVEETAKLLQPHAFKCALLKLNKFNFSVIQQGINNGTHTASIDLYQFFINLIMSKPFTHEDAMEMILHKGPDFLSCNNGKVNGRFINADIQRIRSLYIEYPQASFYTNNHQHAESTHLSKETLFAGTACVHETLQLKMIHPLRQVKFLYLKF